MKRTIGSVGLFVGILPHVVGESPLYEAQAGNFNKSENLNILKKGSLEARETAAKTMDEVRAAMQINYFEDTDLIQSQAERFRQK